MRERATCELPQVHHRLTSNPLVLLGLLRPEQILNEDEQCAIFNDHFVIYGSLAAFFGPLVIMLVSFALTIRLLERQASQLRLQPDSGMRRCRTNGEKEKDGNE